MNPTNHLPPNTDTEHEVEPVRQFRKQGHNETEAKAEVNQFKRRQASISDDSGSETTVHIYEPNTSLIIDGEPLGRYRGTDRGLKAMRYLSTIRIYSPG